MSHRNYTRPQQTRPSSRSNQFVGRGMIVGSVAAGALFSIERVSAQHHNPFKKYATAAIGGALLSLALQVFSGGRGTMGR